jgi:hypothetical protein
MMDAHETDAKLREIFAQNSPPSHEAHLAAALRPDRAGQPQNGGGRVPKRGPRRRALQTALVGAGALVLAAAAAIGIWQAVEQLRGGQQVIVITNQTTSTAGAGDLQAQVTDGAWELQADREGGAALDSLRFTPDRFYRAIDGGPRFAVVISAGGTKVQVEGNVGDSHLSIDGARTSTDEGRLWYQLNAFAGGLFVIWPVTDGLQAEFTVFGSGVPIAFSYRGRLVKSPSSGSFDAVWAASLAAVNALGPTRVTITQTATGKLLTTGQMAGSQVSVASGAETPQTTSVEELLDISGGRARLTVDAADGRHRTLAVVNGKEKLVIEMDPVSSAKAPATRTTSLEAPTGLALPLWAGNAVAAGQGYSDLLSTVAGGEVSAEQVMDGGGRRLTWLRASDTGTESLTVTLDADLLPVRVQVAGQSGVEGTKSEYSLSIDYRFEAVASFPDSDFSVEVPSYATLAGSTPETGWTPTDSIANGRTAAGVPVKTQTVFSLPEYKSVVWDFSYATARSTLIAKVTALAGASEKHLDLLGGGGYVLRPVRIEQVYTGDGTHNAGDVVTVVESWTSTPSVADPGVTIISSVGFYLPMKAGEQYILLLTNTVYDGDSRLAVGEFGKFVYNDQTKTGDPQHQLSAEVWEVGGPTYREGVPPEYFTLAKQVMEAYGQ